jgi:PBP1b-binding outer membrane lipoprotein LpoB
MMRSIPMLLLTAICWTGCASNKAPNNNLSAFVGADLMFTDVGTTITQPDGSTFTMAQDGIWMSTNYMMRVGHRIIEELPRMPRPRFP